MLKWVVRIFLLLLLFTFGVGGYFYFFPIYPDYNISEEYFQTRFHEQWFDSPENGFHDFKKLIESLDENSEIIWEFDMYYKCYIENNCLADLKDVSEPEREIKLKEFLTNVDKIKNFWIIIDNFLTGFTRITEEYEFISTLNYANDNNGNFSVWEEIIQYTKLISLSRGMIFYNHYTNEKEALKNIVSFYNNVSWLSHNLDSQMIWYLVIITVLTQQFQYLESNIETISPLTKKVIRNTLNKYRLSWDMIQNANKSGYIYGKNIFEKVFLKAYDDANTQLWTSFKIKFFYNHEDTMNLVRKNEYNKINNICEEDRIKKNGRNLLWRILIEWNTVCLTRQYEKQDELFKKREQLIQLLSN